MSAVRGAIMRVTTSSVSVMAALFVACLWLAAAAAPVSASFSASTRHLLSVARTMTLRGDDADATWSGITPDARGADVNCTALETCDACMAESQCGWCSDNSGACLFFNASDSCSSDGWLANDSDACPAPSSTHTALGIALGILAGTMAALLFGALVMVTCQKRLVPKSLLVRSNEEINASDQQQQAVQSVTLPLVSIILTSLGSLSLQGVAIGIDRWDVSTSALYGPTVYGLVGEKVDGGSTLTYSRQCSTIVDAPGLDDSDAFAACTTQMWAGIVTLVFGCAAALASLLLLVLACHARRPASRDRLGVHALRGWALALLGTAFSFVAVIDWLAFHVLQVHTGQDPSASVQLGPSWFLMLAAGALTLLALLAARLIVQRAPPPPAPPSSSSHARSFALTKPLVGDHAGDTIQHFL